MAVAVTAEENETEPIPSVKDLASSEPSRRRKTLQQTISHLELRPTSHPLTHTQALQLWRGFHVALYMHDSKNQLSVQTLIATLASTFRIMRNKDAELRQRSPASGDSTTSPDSDVRDSSVKTPKGGDDPDDDDDDEFAGFGDEDDDAGDDAGNNVWLSTYSAAFWETISREWSGVDQWRMNKYLLLIRFVLREILSISLTAYVGRDSLDPDHDRARKSDSPQQVGRQEDDGRRKAKTKKRKGVEVRAGDDDGQTTESKKVKHADRHSTDPAMSNAPQEATAEPVLPTSHPNQNQTRNHNQRQDESPDPSVVESQASILSQWPLSPRSRHVSDGLRLHVLDIYLDELFLSAETVVSSMPSLDLVHLDGTLAADGGGGAAAAAAAEDDKRTILKTILRERMMAPVRLVATDGLAKNVRLRAKEVLREFEVRMEKKDD